MPTVIPITAQANDDVRCYLQGMTALHKKMRTMRANAPCWCCGGTGRFDKSACLCPDELRMHSGLMFQERPDSARLDPPVEIVRCRACWKAYRVDGVPYDELARDAEWIAARQAQERLAAGLFAEETA